MRQKFSILMNQPIYVTFSFLELMYDFNYNFIKRIYPLNRAILLFTDTDSLTYHIKTEDLKNDMKSLSSKFDFSEYTKDHSFLSETNKNVLGKFKTS